MPKIWDCKDSKNSANCKAFCKIFQLFSTRNFSANYAFIRNLRHPPQIFSQLFRHAVFGPQNGPVKREQKQALFLRERNRRRQAMADR